MPPKMVERMTRMQANSEYFLAHLLPATIGYTPDAAALRAGRAGPWIVVGAGDGSADRMPHLAALTLAERLGITPARFPGDTRASQPTQGHSPKLSTTYSTAANSAEMFASPQKTASPGHWAYARRPARAAAMDGSREPRWGPAAGLPPAATPARRVALARRQEPPQS